MRGRIAPEEFVIQSHRGAGILAPDNTLAAFEMGWKFGTIPECDVRTTRDGVLVAFHDENFGKVVVGADAALKKKKVSDLSWGEVSELDVRALHGEKFRGQHVPRISDIFQQMRGRPERRLYMDTKDLDLQRLTKLVQEHHVGKQVLLASSDQGLIRQWRKLVPESGTLLWMGGAKPALRRRLDALRATGFEGVSQLQVHVTEPKGMDLSKPDPFTPSDAFLREVGAELRRHDITLQVLLYPAGKHGAAAYRRLLDLGVMSFATDTPDSTVEAVRGFYAGDPGH